MNKNAEKMTDSICINQHIYTVSASFVPHLKVPRIIKTGLVHQKLLIIQIISVPRHKILRHPFVAFVETIFVHANVFFVGN